MIAGAPPQNELTILYCAFYLFFFLQAGAQATAQALTSQQQSVVASYIQQKTAGAQQNFFTKRPPVNPQQYYCEVCRISCACAAVSVKYAYVMPYRSRKIWWFGGLYYSHQIEIRQNFLLAYIHMVILYRTAKFKFANIFAIAILGSTAKFNSHQYFWLYDTCVRCPMGICDF